MTEPAARLNTSQPHIRAGEKPGWTAIALVAAFVLAAVGMFGLGARLVRRSPAPDLSAVAVIPFANAGADGGSGPSGALFAQQLAVALSATGEVHLASGPTAGSLIEGSLRKSGGTIRVAAWLVRAADRKALWTHTVEFRESDADRVRSKIARGIADALHQRAAVETAR
jgi:hypothetical protein